MLIVVGFRIIKPDDIVLAWKIGPIQQTVMVITFVLTLIMPLQFAVMSGVALSILMSVTRKSSKVSIKRWVREPGELPIEEDVLAEIPPATELILIPYGNLFFAAAPVFDEVLSAITENSRHSVVVLNLRQREDLGGTFLDVLERYAEKLQEQDSRLILAEINRNLMDRLDRTGYVEKFGRGNIFLGTERVFESILDAEYIAKKWIAEQAKQNPTREIAPPADETAPPPEASNNENI